MKLKSKISYLLIISTIIINTDYALHLQQNTSSQLQGLKDQQKTISGQIKSIVRYSNNITNQLQNVSSDKQRISILQKALNDQRQMIFNLKNKIIYPFNQSETACKQLTEQQKTAYRQKLNITRNQLTQLQSINNKLNQNSPQVKRVNDNIKKQFILLQSIQDTLNVKCKQNLTPTIFQSNLKATNWVLGPQTMKNLKQQYAQRAFIWHNITNCPIQTPFYQPKIQKCINCQQPKPLFNMFNKTCIQCQIDEQFDADKKKCIPKSHYTNFTKLINWNLDGGKLPQINPKLTPCPDQNPYFDGSKCTQCLLPLYWSVSANACKKCNDNFKFDQNTRACQKIVNQQLTLLQNTKWTSQNLTQVLQKRTQILQENKTNGNYHYCPDTNKPYYDGTTCISCGYFNIDSLKCVQKPAGTEYDYNMKRFLVPEDKKQTNPNAPRYVSSSNLTDTDLVNCNQSYPYYDGIACVQCLKPFDIFNVDNKKCISCNADEILVQNLHKCQPRRKIKVSENFDKLLATPKVSVAQYKENIVRTINDNSDSIIQPCTQKSHYSNFTNCYPCNNGQYFNVENYKCQNCDGIYYDTNQTCKAKVYIFTNLKAQKIIDMQGKTVESENAKISQFLKDHPESYVCPIDNPYAIQNKTCGTCPDLFSYSQLKCKSCTEFFIYVPDSRKCVQAKMLVNLTDSHRILVSDSQTLTSFKESQQKVRSQNPNTWKDCPGDRPYTQNRQSCFNCSQNTPYFNYTIKQCQSCPQHYVFNPQTVRCAQQFFITLINSNTEPRMIGYDNYSLTDYKSQQQAFKISHPYVLCNQSAPFGTLIGCKQCNQPTSFYDIRKKDCSDVKYFINFQKISPDYILPSDKNLDFYISEQQKYKKQATFLTKKCSDLTPYTNDRGSCFNCSNGEFFNFYNRKCQKCPNGQSYVRISKSCKQLFHVTKINNVTELKMKGYPNYTLDDYQRQQTDLKSKNPFQQCPDNAPYGTITGCQQCQQPTPYFDIKKLVCSNAKKLINFNNTGQNYILGDGKNLSFYQQNQNNFKRYSQSLTVDCPSEVPFTSDRQNCFVCKEPYTIFNFETKKCQSCPRGSQFSNQKKKCLRLFYITNFNQQSQKKMVATKDYTIQTYKSDEDKLKKENPFKDCSSTQPYGTLDGCKKCTIPQEYFDIKNRICTTVKKLINFESVGNNYLLKQGKNLTDYQKDQQNFASTSSIPTVNCPSTTPFTSNRVDCFTCTTPTLYFNFQTNNCQNCPSGDIYDEKSKKCIKKQYYTLFNPTTQNKLLQSDNLTLSQYKDDQLKIKGQAGSQQCLQEKPFATSIECIQCTSQAPYFNIKSLRCQTCDTGKNYFSQKHQCLIPSYLTDFSNPNIKEAQDLKIQDAKKIENDREAQPGHMPVNCAGQKPFATLTGCISCNDTKAQYFNIKTLSCEGCIEFYQYFENHTCKDNIILTNTTDMITYLGVDNYTKYNVQKMNNFTFLNNKHVKDCPAQKPFYGIEKLCIPCDNRSEPIFNLKERKCMFVSQLLKSNPDYMKFYIQKDSQTMSNLKRQISVLRSKGVNVKLCSEDKPYLSHNTCIGCDEPIKYFDLALQICKECAKGQKCISA